MERARLAAMLAGVAALVVLSPGCGDDSEESSAAAQADTGGLAKAQYVRKATAICAQRHARIADELASFSDGLGQDDVIDEAEAAEAMEEVVLPGFRAEYEELRALRPPRPDADFLDLMLSKFSRSLENGEEDLDRLFRVKLSAYSEFAEGR